MHFSIKRRWLVVTEVLGVVSFLIKYLAVVLVTTLRIDQAIKFFWTFMLLLAALSMGLVLVV